MSEMLSRSGVPALDLPATTNLSARFPTNPTPVPPLLSSLSAGWNGILVEQRRVMPGVRDKGPNLRHYLALNLGNPITLTQRRDGRTHKSFMSGDRLMVMPAGVPSWWFQEEEGDVMPVYLDPSFLLDTAAATGGRDRGVELTNCFEAEDPQASRICRTMLAELDASCPNGRLFGDSLATALAVHLLRTYTVRAAHVPEYAGGLSPNDLRRALAFIQANLNADLSLAEISATVHLSPYHFARLFKQSTGQSPHRYVNAQRVERAKGLLRSGRLSVGEVAQSVGFSDQSKLAGHFKRLVGVSPAQFRSY